MAVIEDFADENSVCHADCTYLMDLLRRNDDGKDAYGPSMVGFSLLWRGQKRLAKPLCCRHGPATIAAMAVIMPRGLSFIHIPKTGGGFEDPLKKPSLRVLKGGKAPQQVLITGMNALVSWSRTWFRRCLSCIVYQEL